MNVTPNGRNVMTESSSPRSSRSLISVSRRDTHAGHVDSSCIPKACRRAMCGSLAYVIIFFMLLALRSWNLISIDSALEAPAQAGTHASR